MKLVIFIFLINSFLYAQINVVTAEESKIKSIDKKELSNIYLKKQVKLGNKKIIPIDNSSDYIEFHKKVTKKSPSQIHAYWMKEIFTGKKRPPKRVEAKDLEDELEKENTISYTTKKIEAKVINEIK